MERRECRLDADPGETREMVEQRRGGEPDVGRRGDDQIL
jgi:hypothetical protein